MCDMHTTETWISTSKSMQHACWVKHSHPPFCVHRLERTQLQQELASVRVGREEAQQALEELQYKQASLQQQQAWGQQQLEDVQAR